jgi:hypothetical protein
MQKTKFAKIIQSGFSCSEAKIVSSHAQQDTAKVFTLQQHWVKALELNL